MKKEVMKSKLLVIVKKYDLLEINVKLMDSDIIEKYKNTMLNVYVNYLYETIEKYNRIIMGSKSIEKRDYGLLYRDEEKGYEDMIL